MEIWLTYPQMNAHVRFWFKWFLSIPKMVVLMTIRFYQKTFSPDHSVWSKVVYPHGYCRFHPTCSQYSYEAVEKLGIIRGLILSAGRIFRCNPWNPGGYDPVPGGVRSKNTDFELK